MSLTRAHNIALSLDGFGTGEGQSLETPFGHAGHRLMQWYLPTPTFRRLAGQPADGAGDDPVVAADEVFAARGWEGIGVEIMGAGKFGPPGWQEDPAWRGWWGEEPPFRTPVVVLTHRPRPAIEMGETTFHFLDAPPAAALEAARELAGGQDVRLGGGPTTVREFLAAGLVDVLHVVVVPILLGRGGRLWDGLEALERDYDVEAVTTPSGVTHLTFTRRGSS